MASSLIVNSHEWILNSCLSRGVYNMQGEAFFFFPYGDKDDGLIFLSHGLL